MFEAYVFTIDLAIPTASPAVFIFLFWSRENLSAYVPAKPIDMFCHLLVIQSISFFTTTMTYLISPPVTQDHVLSCGSTPEEAKRLGCLFDLFSFQWHAPPCHNKPLHDGFLAQDRDDVQSTHMDYTPVATEDVLEGIHAHLRPISGKFHDLHCMYEWLKLIRALA